MSQFISRSLFAVCLPVVLALAVFSAIRATGPATVASQVSVALPQSSDWIAFSAAVEITEPGSPRLIGRYYRSSDGSTRLETGPEDGSMVVISIKNIPSETFYWFSPAPGRGWTAQPLKLPVGGWRPAAYRAEMKGLSKHSERVSGYETYRYISNSGDISLLASELNCFPVMRQSLRTGRREVYSNIVLGEPVLDSMVPPPNVQVRKLDKPAGIVYEGAGPGESLRKPPMPE
jgi:hypothetical protein